jgi:hypothetical protein
MTGIIATEVTSDEDRMEFLPGHLGPHLMCGQSKPFEWAERLSSDYKGGSWKFYDLTAPTGGVIGWYTAPACDKQFNVQQNMNGYKGVMSADAFGITATIFTIAELMQGGDEKLINAYYALMDFADQHAESSAIFGAVD